VRPLRRKARAAEHLRRAVDCLPERTKHAMLDSVRKDPVIAGAYTGPGGGVCPMLGAHRRGGRTDMASFARSWDRYAHASGGLARPATGRELNALAAMLEMSLCAEDSGLGRVVNEVKSERRDRAERAAAREAVRARSRRPTGERDRSKELGSRAGWAWLRPFRRLDEFEAAVRHATAEDATAEDREAERV
jgi:hypothetical protein